VSNPGSAGRAAAALGARGARAGVSRHVYRVRGIVETWTTKKPLVFERRAAHGGGR